MEGYFNQICFSEMADVSLDDLIKKDKEQHKANRVNKKFPQKKFNPNKKFQNRRDNQEQGEENPRQQGDSRPFKKKFIKKRFEQRNPQREVRQPRQEKPKGKPKQEREEDDGKEKQFRTLKVMGLSPQFTNEDLYKLFATEGAMEKCLIEQDNFGRSLTTALVKYHSPDSARSAIQNLNRHKIMNCVLTVQPYKNVKK